MNALTGQIRLDFRSDEPIYLQIVRQIEALVREGTLEPGDQLPTVRELAIDLRINFSTVARAYRMLDEQRLISTQRGRGTFIWDEAGSGAVQEEARARISTETLAVLAQRFIQEAAGLGASADQIEQVVRQQLETYPQEARKTPGKAIGG